MVEMVNLIFSLVLITLATIAIKIKEKNSILFVSACAWLLTKTPFYIFSGPENNQLLDPSIYTTNNISVLILSKSIFIISTFIIYIITAKKKTTPFKMVVAHKATVNALQLIQISIFIGYFFAIGGIENLYSNMSMRGEITKGNNFFIIGLWIISCAIIVFSLGLDKKIQIRNLVLSVAVIYIAYGSRSLSMGLIVIWVTTYFITTQKLPIRIFSIGSGLAIAAACVVFILTPLLRQPDGLEKYANSPQAISLAVSNNWQEIINRLAIPEVEILVIDHFSERNLWQGESWFDLKYLLCPVSICQNKPPIDDGVYLYNISLGYKTFPGTAVSDLYASSYPFETWSIFYANFGIIGVALGGFLIGLLLATINNNCYSEKPSVKLTSLAATGMATLNLCHISNLYFGIFALPIAATYILSLFTSKLGLLSYKNHQF